CVCVRPLLCSYSSCLSRSWHFLLSFFFFNDTAPTEIYTLSLHDALPISHAVVVVGNRHGDGECTSGRVRVTHAERQASQAEGFGDRKSTRLNSSHDQISYAVFCLKKKKKIKTPKTTIHTPSHKEETCSYY